MTPIKLVHRALNSLIFLRDAVENRIPPIDASQARFWSIETCLAASCVPDCDGPTTIVVADADEAPRTQHMVFDGTIEFPSGFAAVDTVADGVLAEFPVAAGTHRVRLWTDGHKGTEVLIFGID